MAVFVLFFGAVGAGFILILLIAITAPKPPPVDLKRESNNSPLIDLDSEQLGKIVAELLDKMGIEIDRLQGGKNEVVEIYAENPEPVTGGKILIHCITAPPDTGILDGPAVGAFIRATRSAYVSKGLLFTTGTFSPEGRLEAEEAPVELFDRDRLMKMIREYFDEDEDPLRNVTSL